MISHYSRVAIIAAVIVIGGATVTFASCDTESKGYYGAPTLASAAAYITCLETKGVSAVAPDDLVPDLMFSGNGPTTPTAHTMADAFERMRASSELTDEQWTAALVEAIGPDAQLIRPNPAVGASQAYQKFTPQGWQDIPTLNLNEKSKVYSKGDLLKNKNTLYLDLTTKSPGQFDVSKSNSIGAGN
jgi:hypothetical protein